MGKYDRKKHKSHEIKSKMPGSYVYSHILYSNPLLMIHMRHRSILFQVHIQSKKSASSFCSMVQN